MCVPTVMVIHLVYSQDVSLKTENVDLTVVREEKSDNQQVRFTFWRPSDA